MDSIKKNILQHINVPALVEDLLKENLKPALDVAVANTDTPLDDVALNALFPVVSVELNKLLKAQWEKLLAD